MLYNYCCKNCGCNNQAQIELNEGIEVLCKNCKHYFETYFEHLNGGGVFIRLKESVGKKIIEEFKFAKCIDADGTNLIPDMEYELVYEDEDEVCIKLENDIEKHFYKERFEIKQEQIFEEVEDD